METSPARENTFDIFRRWGYLQASLDPLGQFLPPEPFPTPAPDGADAQEARRYYCGSIGAEFMHIPSPEKRAWIQERFERDEAPVNTARILTGLIRADIFEQVIQQRYLGTKRFSLEGLTVLIPFLDQLFSTAADNGVTRGLFAMAHRGRLNVMVNTVGRGSHEIFTKFEDVDPRSTMGGGDVKYHMGATGDLITANGKSVHLHLASNPSHLEAVNPVIMGRARAYQERAGKDGKQQVLPMVIHGDAAFAGQGVTAETLNLASLHGYNVGGTIQVITNNLLGFTANPDESNSSRFASDLAKRLPIPIFHVNAEDPEAVVRIAAIAADYRHKFASDVVVDIIGYRRHGHSEMTAAQRGAAAHAAIFGTLPGLDLPEADDSADETPAAEDRIPRSELRQVVKQRDALKRKLALVAGGLGLSATDFSLVETGDAANPYRLAAPAFEAKLRAITPEGADPRVHALEQKLLRQETFLHRGLIDASLISELSAQNAIDALGDQKFSDLTALLRASMKVDVVETEDGQDHVVSARSENGEKLTVAELVRRFLAKRPSLVRSRIRGGIGAGGAGNRNGSPALTPREKGARAGDFIFGNRSAAPSGVPDGRAAADFAFGRPLRRLIDEGEPAPATVTGKTKARR